MNALPSIQQTDKGAGIEQQFTAHGEASLRRIHDDGLRDPEFPYRGTQSDSVLGQQGVGAVRRKSAGIPSLPFEPLQKVYAASARPSLARHPPICAATGSSIDLPYLAFVNAL